MGNRELPSMQTHPCAGKGEHPNFRTSPNVLLHLAVHWPGRRRFALTLLGLGLKIEVTKTD